MCCRLVAQPAADLAAPLVGLAGVLRDLGFDPCAVGGGAIASIPSATTTDGFALWPLFALGVGPLTARGGGQWW